MGRKRGVQFQMGEFYRSDDRSGFTRHASSTQFEWTQLLVGKNLWEARQPQDFVRGVADDQTVPSARPVPPAVFVGPISIGLSQAAAIGDTFLFLEAVNGFSAGDNVGVMMDSGALFNTKVHGAPASDGIHIVGAMPNSAAAGNLVTDYEAPGP